MSLTDEKIAHIDRQVEFLVKEEVTLRVRSESWASTKAEKLRQVIATMQEYRQTLVKGTMLQ
jgi:hypothetical protein